MEDGASPNERLLFACRSANIDLLRSVVKENNHNLSATDGVGNTALHLAAQSGSPDIIRILLESELVMNINAQNKAEGATALHKIAANKNVDPNVAKDIILLLLTYAADPTILNKEKQRADQQPNVHPVVRKCLEAGVLAKELGDDDVESNDDEGDEKDD